MTINYLKYPLKPPKILILCSIVLILLAIISIFIFDIGDAGAYNKEKYLLTKLIAVFLVILTSIITLRSYWQNYPKEIIVTERKIFWKSKTRWVSGGKPLLGNKFISLQRDRFGLLWWLVTTENLSAKKMREIRRYMILQ